MSCWPDPFPVVLRYLLILACVPLTAMAQESSLDSISTKYFQHQLGETKVNVEVTTHKRKKAYVFIRVHDNETTADSVAREIVENEGGVYINIINGGRRLMEFSFQGRNCTFDPNRMFTRTGRLNTLKIFRSYSLAAAQEVKEFASFIISLIPAHATVIALHNNTSDEFSIRSYQRPPHKKASRSVSIHSTMDEDDFVFTTNAALFRHLANKKINSVLQSSTAPDDGSLSIYYAKRRTKYVNIEAEAGHGSEQKRMVEAVTGKL